MEHEHAGMVAEAATARTPRELSLFISAAVVIGDEQEFSTREN